MGHWWLVVGWMRIEEKTKGRLEAALGASTRSTADGNIGCNIQRTKHRVVDH